MRLTQPAPAAGSSRCTSHPRLFPGRATAAPHRSRQAPCCSGPLPATSAAPARTRNGCKSHRDRRSCRVRRSTVRARTADSAHARTPASRCPRDAPADTPEQSGLASPATCSCRPSRTSGPYPPARTIAPAAVYAIPAGDRVLGSESQTTAETHRTARSPRHPCPPPEGTPAESSAHPKAPRPCAPAAAPESAVSLPPTHQAPRSERSAPAGPSSPLGRRW